MVVFILCLTVVILATIATCRFIIDRPRKRRYKVLKDYLTKRTQNLFQSTGSHGSLNKDKLLGSNPSMLIASNLHEIHGGSQQFDPTEAEGLLAHNYDSSSSMPQSQEDISANAASVATTSQTHSGKITFSVGETILEDLVGEEATDSNAAIKQLANEDEVQASNDQTLEGTEEAVKTVSHLLDDKPWSLTRRDSKTFTVEKANLSSVASQNRMN